MRLRELLVVQTLGEVPGELSLTSEADAALQAQADRVEHATVVRLLELLGEAMEAIRAGADARTRLELALVKGARPEVDGSLRALLSRIERLEQGGSPGRASGEPAPVRPAPDRDASVASAIATQALEDEPAPEADPAPEAEPAITDPGAGPAPAPAGAPAADLESVSTLWPAVIDLVRGENALLGALLAEARPIAVDGEDLTLAFASTAQFLKKKAEDPANRVTVGEALRAITGTRWRLSYVLSEEASDESAPAPDGRSEEDWVARFMQEFDAEEISGEWESAAGGDSEGEERSARAVTSNEKGS